MAISLGEILAPDLGFLIYAGIGTILGYMFRREMILNQGIRARDVIIGPQAVAFLGALIGVAMFDMIRQLQSRPYVGTKSGYLIPRP